MPKKKNAKAKTVETLIHDEASRKNIPTAEYQSVMRKEEQDWSDLVVQAPPLYIQEKVHPKVLIDDLRRQTEAQEKTGEPDIDIMDAENNQIQVRINGVDVFHPNTDEVRSDGAEGTACWFIDTDYNEESFFVRQAYFLGANDPYKALKTTLKAEINQEAWDALNSDTSRSFDKPTSGRIAVKEIFKSGTIKIVEDGVDICRDVQALGHGAQRSIQMALIRYLADIKAQDNQHPTRTLLLIDEPELYLHPQAIEHVRLALKSLSKGGYQIIFATHSPLMISSDDIGTTLIVRKNNVNQSYSRKRLSDAINEVVADAPSQTQTLFELSNSSQILFSNKVVVAEGRTEQRLLPEIYRLINDTTLNAHKTALVSPGGTGNTVKCMSILSAMEIPVKAIVDKDDCK